MSERELFLNALELIDPRARAHYLDQACGSDHVLRAKVEALLRSHGEAGGFLEEPVAYEVDATVAHNRPSDPLTVTMGELSAPGSGHSPEPTQADREATGAYMPGSVAGETVDPDKVTGDWSADADSPTETADGHAPAHSLSSHTKIRYFGDYEVQKELGRGGMGVVYKARQVSLNRPVALKMIKAGVLANDAELRRFQNEAEAVALLDHAGIVPVYEVGEHDGQRYFSMKLVEGGNLAEQLVAFKDDPRATAILVALAAEAVHHAHMRSVLHRDLKPANILVDTEGHPHITDFGLAKRVEADIEMTASGAILGTPAYMSPEQAAGHRGAITTATDIYGLGAILYALVTGKAPFGGDSVMETLDAVRNQPPEPPTKFNVHTPKDLETICLKCLEKDPRRRYASAQALADDLHAWLDLRPITARRVGAAERAWLWCKRKPAIAALAATVLAAVVAGTTAVIAVQARANGVLRDKNAELTVANDRITKANADLTAAKVRVKQRFDLAEEAIKLYQGQVGDDLILKADQFKPLRDKLLNGAADFYKKLERLLKDQPDRISRVMMGNAYFELGELTKKIGDKPAALAIHLKGLAVRRNLAYEPDADDQTKVDVAKSLNACGWLLYETGKSPEALARCGEARDLLEGLPPSGPGSEVRRNLLGSVYRTTGIVLVVTGKWAEAIRSYREDLAICQRLADENPAVTDFRSNLAIAHNNLGRMLQNTGKAAEALASYRQALAIRQTLAHESPDFRSRLALLHHSIGLLSYETGKMSEAMRSYREALAIWQRLADENPAHTDYQSRMAVLHASIGYYMLNTGKMAEALASFRRALAIYRKLAEENPTVAKFRDGLAETHNEIGWVYWGTAKMGEALLSYRQALAIQQKVVDENPTVPNRVRHKICACSCPG